LGARPGSYSYDRYKSKKDDGDGDGGKALLSWPQGSDEALVTTTIEAVYLCRDLVTTPAEDLGPGTRYSSFEGKPNPPIPACSHAWQPLLGIHCPWTAGLVNKCLSMSACLPCVCLPPAFTCAKETCPQRAALI
jgi:hypothetical protein